MRQIDGDPRQIDKDLRRANAIETQTQGILQSLHRAFGCDRVNDGYFRDFIGEFLHEHPLAAASRRQAAVHEAAHMVAYEALGMVASRASIRGTTFGRNGWSGTAHPLEMLPLTSSSNLIREAIAAYVGPRAESRLAGGDECSSPGERLECFLLASLADDLVDAKGNLFVAVLAQADRIIDAYESLIFAIADVLERQRRITRVHKKVANALALVHAKGLPELPQVYPASH
jgi:hypothetical protein